MGEESVERKERKGRSKLSKLLRLSAVAGLVVWLVQKKRSKTAQGDGLWRDGMSGGPGPGS